MGSRLLAMASISLIHLLLISLARLVRADCECGYSIKNQKNDLETYTFTDMIETDFTRMNNMVHNTDWVPTSYEVSAEKGRGEYGKIFDKENVVHRREGSEEDPQPPEDAVRGLELVVDQELVDGHVPGAEIDSARLDIHWGSFRVGMRTTDINGTCAAFFWVCCLSYSSTRTDTRLELRLNCSISTTHRRLTWSSSHASSFLIKIITRSAW